MIRKLVIANLSLLALLLASAVVNAWTHGTVAQSVLTSLQIDASPPSLGSDGFRWAVGVNCTTDGSNLTPNFSADTCISFNPTASNGVNANGTTPTGEALSAKQTFSAVNIFGQNVAAGQRVNINNQQNCYGMGDCSAAVMVVNYAGGPVNGDEGQAFQLFSRLNQQNHLDTGTVASVTRTTCNTTLTQAISIPNSAPAPQTVTVASTTGCNVNDWVVIDQQMVTGTQGDEAVQITAVGSGTISGAFVFPHTNGTTVTPATVIGVTVTGGTLGQMRVMVNTGTASTYSTGTVSAISGGNFTGSGTTWTNSMVGGNSGNIGCIALSDDDFSGAGFTGTLKSWYQITSINSSTSMGIFSFSVAGDQAYHGNGPGNGAYIIRPCATILKVVGSTAIAETTATTWTVGDTVEVAISPYPDVSGMLWSLNKFSPGGVARTFESVLVGGDRSFQQGFSLGSGMNRGDTKQDYIPFIQGFACSQCGTGLILTQSADQAILLDDAGGTAGTGTIATSGGVITLTLSGFTGAAGPSNIITGPGIPGRTFIASQTGGTPGGNGTYTLAIQGCGSADGGLVPCSINVGPIPVQIGHTDIGGKIAWTGMNLSIMPNNANLGMDISMSSFGADKLSSKSAAIVGSGSLGALQFNGLMGTTAVAFASLPTCAAGLEGYSMGVNNSSTATYNATVTGSGSNHVVAYCNGTNWVAH